LTAFANAGPKIALKSGRTDIDYVVSSFNTAANLQPSSDTYVIRQSLVAHPASIHKAVFVGLCEPLG